MQQNPAVLTLTGYAPAWRLKHSMQCTFVKSVSYIEGGGEAKCLRLSAQICTETLINWSVTLKYKMKPRIGYMPPLMTAFFSFMGHTQHSCHLWGKSLLLWFSSFEHKVVRITHVGDVISSVGVLDILHICPLLVLWQQIQVHKH